jgi:hypothetical protein
MYPSSRSRIRIITLTIAVAALLLTNFGTLAAPEAISQKDREFAVKHLEETKSKFLASVEGLSEAQWKFKPAPERWSVAEVAEHITVSEELILSLVTDRVLKTPEAKPPEGAMTDEGIIKALTDRTNKASAPEMLKPTGRWATQADLVKDFVARRAKTLAYVKETQDALRSHSTPHPVFKSLDGYQWLLLLSAHSARHTAQIEEVKADPGFPKK